MKKIKKILGLILGFLCVVSFMFLGIKCLAMEPSEHSGKNFYGSGIPSECGNEVKFLFRCSNCDDGWLRCSQKK